MGAEVSVFKLPMHRRMATFVRSPRKMPLLLIFFSNPKIFWMLLPDLQPNLTYINVRKFLISFLLYRYATWINNNL